MAEHPEIDIDEKDSEIIPDKEAGSYLSEKQDYTERPQKDKITDKVLISVADLIILALSYIAVLLTKYGDLRLSLQTYAPFFIIISLVWITVSLMRDKINSVKIINFAALLNGVVATNLIIVSIIALIMYAFRHEHYSRSVVFGTAILATLQELIIGMVYISYKKATLQDFEKYANYRRYSTPSEYELVERNNGNGRHGQPLSSLSKNILHAIEKELGAELAGSVINMAGAGLSEHSAVLSTITVFNISNLPEEKYDYMINLHRINDIKKLDEFICTVNKKLGTGGSFLCCVETKDQRKTRLLKKYPPVLNYIYYCIDFVIKRVFPKFRFTYPLYNLLTRGENFVISRAEALGRLARCGFRINREAFIGNNLYIEAIKCAEVQSVDGNSYGLLIALPRIGREGKLIKVYKLRTMHPYSEYIQDYVYGLYDLQNGGKFRYDFRLTTLGRICRRVWLDELPMLINWIRGEMKLVGVRPLSRQYFQLYSRELQERRIKYKPGLIPPFYADMPEDIKAIQESELRYLDSYDRHPILTDIRYFFRSLFNIVFHRARSS
jgi:lipopolysaccharide/colanic/teichoic acid biosynthesis glycosyltransferase